MEPARKIKNYKGRTSLIGKTPSRKTKEMIPWESQLERDYVALVEADPEVTRICSQPFKIEYILDGKKHSYTPDYWVERRKKRNSVVEIKPSEYVDKFRELYEAVQIECAVKGWDYVVLTEKEIRFQPRLDNAKLLCRYSWNELPEEAALLIGPFLKAGQTRTLGELKSLFRQRGIPGTMVFTLMYLSAFSFDINKPFTDDLKIWVQGGAE